MSDHTDAAETASTEEASQAWCPQRAGQARCWLQRAVECLNLHRDLVGGALPEGLSPMADARRAAAMAGNVRSMRVALDRLEAELEALRSGADPQLHATALAAIEQGASDVRVYLQALPCPDF